MKWLLPMILFSCPLWARPVVLVSYYDAFGRAAFNNSERVAKRLEAKINNGTGPYSISLCALPTVFDRSYAALEDCLKAMPEAPVMVLGLGESNCNFKIETIMRNMDTTKAADNAGNERKNQVIIPEAPAAIGLKYPISQMYCALDSKVRNEMEISNNAGTFVCNNTAFQMSYHYENIQFGFVHVPANHCRNLEQKSISAVESLDTMLKTAVEVLKNDYGVRRLLTTKKEIEVLRYGSETKDKCPQEFYKRTKGVDERGIWDIFKAD